jgi:hypothetical protein
MNRSLHESEPAAKQSIYVALLIGCNVPRGNGERNRGARLKTRFPLTARIPGFLHVRANKAFNFSSVRWVRAGYNVTDDTAR